MENDKGYEWAYSEHALYDDGYGDEFAIDDLPCALYVRRFGRTEHYNVIGHDLLRFVLESIDNADMGVIDAHKGNILLDVNVNDIDVLINTPFA